MSVVGRGLPQTILVLGIARGIGGSRVVRGAVVGTKENDYFLAAKAVGTPTTQILVRHLLPNIVFGDAVRDLLDPRLRGRLGRYGAARDQRGERPQLAP